MKACSTAPAASEFRVSSWVPFSPKCHMTAHNPKQTFIYLKGTSIRKKTVQSGSLPLLRTDNEMSVPFKTHRATLTFVYELIFILQYVKKDPWDHFSKDMFSIKMDYLQFSMSIRPGVPKSSPPESSWVFCPLGRNTSSKKSGMPG